MLNDQSVSKALMLKMLEKHQKGFVIDPFLIFSVHEWRLFPRKVLNGIQRKNLGPVIVVRSAALTEDSADSMPPGTYHTELNVPMDSDEKISTAVEKVISSYQRDVHGGGINELNEVLIQRQVLAPLMSGLITSHEQNSENPYYLVEYDDETGRTDTVTGGYACKKAYIFRKGVRIPPPWNAIAKAIRSIELLLDTNNLVIEFALTGDKLVHIFQARQLPATYRITLQTETGITQKIRLAQGFIRSHSSTIWSNMADWNPAEMLGEHPKPLDSSLYRFLIANGTWAKARASLGYRDATPKELIDDIAGYPYINVEASFESLCPASLSDSLARRLVKNRIDFLRNNPELHDKVEFEVMFTCADVVRPARTQVLADAGFPAREVAFIENALTTLTSSHLTNVQTILDEDMLRRKKLMNWLQRSSLSTEDVNGHLAELDYIVAALENCRDRGTFSFSRLSRMAFVARDLLGRMVVAGALSNDEYESFWRSIDTTATNVVAAIRDLSNGRLSKADFNKVYGHLRPHTYDITSPRYDQSELINITNVHEQGGCRKYSADFKPDIYSSISKCLAMSGLPDDPHRFLNFVSVAVQAREQSKFEFSALLSACLEEIAHLGEIVGLNRVELSFLTVDDIIEANNLQPGLAQLKQFWVENISFRKVEWENDARIHLPALITEADDLAVVRPTKSKPNFITTREAEGPIVILKDSRPSPSLDLFGKIVVLEAADPGYDWIFSGQLIALVTKYGGVASHMAIRAAQFGIPAVIGCGQELYNEFCIHERTRIDCGKKTIEFTTRDREGTI
jgi:Pyruvate phosphate dikinase, PEP/pyruvate binding domain./PEP-utilising enzyme, mobile domain.